MKAKLGTVALVVLGSVLCSLVTVLVVQKYSHNQSYVWINVNKVYNDFDMKKELEKKFEVVQQARKKITDSLEFELRVLAKKIQESGEKADKTEIALFSAKKDNYINRKQEFDSDNEQTQKNYNEQILNQINQYLKDYGQENGYLMVLGADGTGSLMYAQESVDVTNEVTVFINNKYKGLN